MNRVVLSYDFLVGIACFNTANRYKMSGNSFRQKLADKGQEYFENLSADKLRNNFYGYLIISFAIFNFENIILILKSKNTIEMTLIYIQAQPEFSWNFFWKPLWSGITASLLMPMITAAYVVFTSVFDSIRTESKGFGSTLWERVKVYNESRLNSAKEELVEQEKKLVIKKNQYNDIQRDIRILETTRSDLEKYLIELAKVYAIYNNNYSHRDMEGLIEQLEKADILKHFPDKNTLIRLHSFCKQNPSKPILDNTSESTPVSDTSKEII